jgi:hypothetical protein
MEFEGCRRLGAKAMNEEQRLFLVQARSAFSVYNSLTSNKSIHHCHAIHYLQMATELLAKAHGWGFGPVEKSHDMLVPFLQGLANNRKARNQLGFRHQKENWKHTIKKLIPIAEELQGMAPASAKDGPNPEYPWPPKAPANAPAEFAFPLWEKLTEHSSGRSLISWLHVLFERADEFM